MATNKEEILEAIKQMTVLDLAELVKALETEFGVSAAAPVAVAAVASSGGQSSSATEEEEEKTEFTVTLTEIGPNKISVIKAVREVTTLGLKEAKDLVEAAPKAIKEATTKDDAEAIRTKIAEVGGVATVE